MERFNVVLGASGGIGGAFVRRLLQRDAAARVIAIARRHEITPLLRELKETHTDRLHILTGIDAANEEQMSAAARSVRDTIREQAAEKHAGIAFFFSAIGALHLNDGKTLPEKTIRSIELPVVEEIFRANVFGQMLALKHFAPLMQKKSLTTAKEPALMAFMSARVGSIGDNHMGGWISYRSAKAAMNQVMRTAAIELRHKNVACVALHPNLVSTALSEPITAAGGGKQYTPFTPDESAEKLLDVCDSITIERTGQFYDYEGEVIEW